MMTNEEFTHLIDIRCYIDDHLKNNLPVKCICIKTFEVPHYENGKFTNYNVVTKGSIWHIKWRFFHYILENCNTRRCIGMIEEYFFEFFKVLTNEVITNEEWK